MEIFLIVAYRSLRKQKKCPVMNNKRFEKLVSEAKFELLVTENSISNGLMLQDSDRAAISRDAIYVGTEKKLYKVERVLDSAHGPPVVTQLVDLEALDLVKEAISDPFAWVAWRGIICQVNSRQTAIFDNRRSGNNPFESPKVLRDPRFQLQGDRNDTFTHIIGTGVMVTEAGVLGFVNQLQQLAFISLSRYTAKDPLHFASFVPLAFRDKQMIVCRYVRPHWYAVSSISHHLLVISSKTCKVVQQVKLQMKHADNSEKIFGFAPSGKSLITLSHWGGGNNSLQISCFDRSSGECRDTVDMGHHASGYGLLQSLDFSLRTNAALLVVGMGRAQFHLIGCHNHKLNMLQTVLVNGEGSAAIHSCAGRLKIYKGREYYVVCDNQKTNVFKLNYSLK